MTRDELKKTDKTACKMFAAFFLIFSVLAFALCLLCPVTGIRVALLVVSILSSLAAGFVVVDCKIRQSL